MGQFISMGGSIATLSLAPMLLSRTGAGVPQSL